MGGTKRWTTAAALTAGLVLALAGGPAGALAQGAGGPRADGPTTAGPATVRTGGTTPEGVAYLDAVRVAASPPAIDGSLDDDAWRSAPVATDFVQFQPDEGGPASQRSEARVLYGDDALYVAFRAWDTAPDSIEGQLTRRDQPSYSDVVSVIVDSYFDRRTGFEFSVNPVGVKYDTYRFDDTQTDPGWDAVWDAAARIDDRGWTAEFRIPYSQLRFRDAPVQTWGIQFFRKIVRLDEITVWAPVGRSDAAIVSRTGELRGLKDLEPPRRLELTPYSLARVDRGPGDEANPFFRRTDPSATVGADLKFGVTSDLTLDVTINPDFGQVEADPAQVNLSAFETFLPERRPFFVEGSNLFTFPIALGDGDGADESLFYSRRVGRAPQGSPDRDGGHADAPEETTILGAWKLSGKTAGGWSVGTMMAVTDRESARVAPADGPHHDQTVEPFSTYGVARVSRDFRQGRSAVGVIGTAVNRDAESADSLGLRSSAYTLGVDARHRFGDDRYSVSAYLLGSHIRGSAEAMARAQLSSARYYQRPDAEHLDFDPTRTTLSGISAQASVARISGGHWRWSTGFQTRSPGFEVNDAGFMREADFTTVFGYVGYDQSTPQGPFRRWRLNLNGWNAFSYGWERYNSGGNLNANFQLRSFWGGFAGVNYDRGGLSNGLLRGGPAFLREPQINGWGGLNSDSRRAVRLHLNANWSVRPESDSWRVGLVPTVVWRPSGRARLNVGAFINRNVDDRQWVARIDAADPAYLFGRLDQTTVGITGRVDYAFTPDLSVQLYAQPFVSAGDYDDFKRVADPRAERYDDRFSAVEPVLGADGRYRLDLDADGELESFRKPDFDVLQFRSNAVLRWEYRPGSTLFVVWSQGRDRLDRNGDFHFRDGLRDLFDVHPSNVFMVKVSYWLNP